MYEANDANAGEGFSRHAVLSERVSVRCTTRTFAAVVRAAVRQFFVAGLSFSLCGAALAQQAKVTLQLDFLLNGYHAPFFVAKEKGFYRDAGLDVNILPGKGSNAAVKIVGAGNAEFGFPDFGTTANAVSQGIPVTAIAAFVYDTPAVIISFADKPVKVPADLEGKSISVAPSSGTGVMFPAFMKANHVDANKVQQIDYSFGAMLPSFLSGKTDATIGYYFGEYLAAKSESKDRPIVVLKMADFDVHSYANGIVVNNRFMASYPEVVRGFVEASIKGAKYAFAHPDEAVAAEAKYTETPVATLRDQFLLAAQLMNTPEARENGYGVMSADKWATTQKLQVDYGRQKQMVPDATLWTNKFLR